MRDCEWMHPVVRSLTAQEVTRLKESNDWKESGGVVVGSKVVADRATRQSATSLIVEFVCEKKKEREREGAVTAKRNPGGNTWKDRVIYCYGRLLSRSVWVSKGGASARLSWYIYRTNTDTTGAYITRKSHSGLCQGNVQRCRPLPIHPAGCPNTYLQLYSTSYSLIRIITTCWNRTKFIHRTTLLHYHEHLIRNYYLETNISLLPNCLHTFLIYVLSKNLTNHPWDQGPSFRGLSYCIAEFNLSKSYDFEIRKYDLDSSEADFGWNNGNFRRM